MFSVFDIFRKNRQQKSGYAPPEQESAQSIFSETYADGVAYAVDGKVVCVSSALKREETEELIKQATLLHQEVFDAVKNIYMAQGVALIALWPAVAKLSEKLVDATAVSCSVCLRVCLADYPAGQPYVFGHVANVCMMSLQLARGLGYERGRLLELTEAAFMHDIGMTRFLDLANKPGKLTEQEMAEIKRHPQIGVTIVNESGAGFPAAVLDAIGQEHERMDGSGYPQGLKDTQISDAAQIIGLVDVYEAMLHTRPYRKKLTPSATMHAILENKRAFGYAAVKALIERIGIFPVGSLVRLNTREIAQVVRDNVQSPLRPVVSVICTPEGQQLKNFRQVDLLGNPLIYIEECLDCPLPQGV